MNDQHLSGHHARVLHEILGHPVPHNLEWKDVVGLISAIGSVLERHDGNFDFRVGAASAVFRRPHHKDMDVEDVVRLRHLLTQAGMSDGTAAAATPAAVVVIDHHSARFFEPASGTRLAEREHVQPKDPHGFERHLEHRKEADYQGERVPEDDDYYERVAQKLKAAGTILLIGDGTGKSSAVDYFVRYLEKNHPDISARVARTAHADLSALTLGDIERIATAP